MVTKLQEKAIVSSQVTTETRDQLLRRARDADRSPSAEIRRALEQHLADETEEQ